MLPSLVASPRSERLPASLGTNAFALGPARGRAIAKATIRVFGGADVSRAHCGEHEREIAGLVADSLRRDHGGQTDSYWLRQVPKRGGKRAPGVSSRGRLMIALGRAPREFRGR